MESRRNRWIDRAVTVAAVLSAFALCNAVSMPLSRSFATGLLFATSFLGIQRIYSAVIDILFILLKRTSPDNRTA